MSYLEQTAQELHEKCRNTLTGIIATDMAKKGMNIDDMMYLNEQYGIEFDVEAIVNATA